MSPFQGFTVNPKLELKMESSLAVREPRGAAMPPSPWKLKMKN